MLEAFHEPQSGGGDMSASTTLPHKDLNRRKSVSQMTSQFRYRRFHARGRSPTEDTPVRRRFLSSRFLCSRADTPPPCYPLFCHDSSRNRAMPPRVGTDEFGPRGQCRARAWNSNHLGILPLVTPFRKGLRHNADATLRNSQHIRPPNVLNIAARQI